LAVGEQHRAEGAIIRPIINRPAKRSILSSKAGSGWNPAVRAAGFRVRQPFDR